MSPKQSEFIKGVFDCSVPYTPENKTVARKILVEHPYNYLNPPFESYRPGYMTEWQRNELNWFVLLCSMKERVLVAETII